LKALLENYFKLSIIFLEEVLREGSSNQNTIFHILFKPMQATCKGYLLKMILLSKKVCIEKGDLKTICK
jgi:hypothetical protein